MSGSFSMAAEAAAAVRARWSRPPAPAIAEILSPEVMADDDILAETLAADAEERRRRGMPVRLEDYLVAMPSIAGRPSACRAVLMAEAVARASEPPDAVRADLTARLPALAPEVETVMGLASLLHDAVADAASVREPGAMLGKYRLHSRLGEGAFGEVWQAWDTELERYVALKILRTAHHSGIRGVQRFLAEIRAAAAIDHESVVRIHAAGQFSETGEYYIDAQLVGEPSPAPDDPRAVHPGRTLEQRLEQGPIPAREAAALIGAAARGVAAAHSRGVTHRDIKPSNILVRTSGRPLVADFGLSVSGFTVRPAQPPTGTRTGNREHAPARRVAGTPAYMSPEQARGEGATPLSDVYSLGATLRALLTGRPPYEPVPGTEESARDQVIRMARDGGLRPLREVRPGLPRTLCAICDRACAAEGPARYSSAERLAADLEAFLQHRPTLADPPGALASAAMWCHRHALTSIVGGAALLIIVASTAGFIVRLTHERDQAMAARADASKQRDAAIEARDAVETINSFIARTFDSTRGREGTSEITVNDAINLASGRVGRTFADRPLLEAGVRHFLGQAALGAHNLPEARRQLDRAWELRSAILGPAARDSLATRLRMAELLAGESKQAESDALIQEIFDPLRAAAGEEAPDTLRALSWLGNVKRRQGDLNGAVEMLERAGAAYRRVPQVGTTHRQMNLNWLVLAYAELKEYERAESAQREIIAMNQADLGPDDISTLNATQALGWVLRLAGEPAEAEAVYRDVLGRYRATVGPSHVGTLHVVIELGVVLLDSNPTEALALAREAKADAQVHGRGNQFELRALIAEGRALALVDQPDEAERSLRTALDGALEHRSAQLAQDAASQLIRLLRRQGKTAEIEAVRARLPARPSPDR